MSAEDKGKRVACLELVFDRKPQWSLSFLQAQLADHSLMGARMVLALLVAFLVTNVAVLYSSASSAATGGMATFALCRCPKVCV